MSDEPKITNTAEGVSFEAYQVIGALSDAVGLFGHPAVIRALDYFGYEEWKRVGSEILPWHIDVADRVVDLVAENARLRIAFHDAIRRPLGVTPDSGAEFYDARMADEAEARRSGKGLS